VSPLIYQVVNSFTNNYRNMKKTILLSLAVWLFSIVQLSAAVIYQDLSPDVVLQNPGPNGTWNKHTIDFDQDGEYDVEFNNRFDPLIMAYTYNGFTINYNEIAIISSPASRDTAFMNPFSAGQSIGPSFPTWTSRSGFGWVSTYLWLPSIPHIMGQGEVFLGIRFKAGSGGPVHYGWVRLEVKNNKDLVLKDYAWEDVAGRAITAGAGPVLATSISIQGRGGQANIGAVGQTLQMEATILPANVQSTNVAWSVINQTGSATISSTGLLTAQSQGVLQVVGATTDGSNLSDTVSISIGSGVLVSSINLSSQGNITAINNPNGTLQLIAQVIPANASDPSVNWSVSSGAGIVSVDQAGLVTALSNGTAKVRATAQDGTGIFGEMTLTASNQGLAVTHISINSQGSSKVITDPGGTLQMRATILPALAANKSLSWQIQNLDGRASVSSSGLVQARADGRVRVIAHAMDGSGVFSSPFEITIYNQALNVDPENSLAFSLAPNPVSGILNITSERRIAQVIVMTSSGKQMRNIPYAISAQRASISTEGLRPGMYFVKVIDIDGRYSVKPVSKL
jgi:uncharacterized protein YjdB